MQVGLSKLARLCARQVALAADELLSIKLQRSQQRQQSQAWKQNQYEARKLEVENDKKKMEPLREKLASVTQKTRRLLRTTGYAAAQYRSFENEFAAAKKEFETLKPRLPKDETNLIDAYDVLFRISDSESLSIESELGLAKCVRPLVLFLNSRARSTSPACSTTFTAWCLNRPSGFYWLRLGVPTNNATIMHPQWLPGH